MATVDGMDESGFGKFKLSKRMDKMQLVADRGWQIVDHSDAWGLRREDHDINLNYWSIPQRILFDRSCCIAQEKKNVKN